MKISLFVLPIIATSLFLVGLCGNIFSPSDKKNTLTNKTTHLETPLGETIQLDDLTKNAKLKGKWIVLDFWASWNSESLKEKNLLNDVYSQYNTKNLEIVSVSLDNSKERWKNAVAQNNSSWLEVSDLKGWESAACNKYNVSALPYRILLNPQGEIVKKTNSNQELVKTLEEVL
ncbi:TlpA family protein disulfide reductase [Bernardetia sp.]|uniref:TlpA family protein disulfide reductase n=1 Tax=Bernardetia sp. TaxID=1937974 RepID=UPI0025C620B9|nr:thioredoxin family protein [Bernardetia sp.]